jgi:hypothetical protein
MRLAGRMRPSRIEASWGPSSILDARPSHPLEASRLLHMGKTCETNRSGSRKAVVAVTLRIVAAATLLVATRVWLAWREPLAASGLLAAAAVLTAASFLPFKWAARVLLAVSVCAVTSLLGELVLRLFRGPQFAVIYTADPVLLHRLIPGARKVFQHDAANGAARVDVRINSDGFRGPELTTDQKGARIVVFGDSCVEGEFSALEATFCMRLAEHLRENTGRQVEAVNAGVVGYGPDQVALRMAAELPRLKPAVAVVVLFADNDYGDMVRNRIFGIQGDHLREREYHLSESLAATFVRAAEMPHLLRAAKKAWEGLTRAPVGDMPAPDNTLMAAWLSACRSDYEASVLRGDSAVDNLLSDHYDADIALEPTAESSRHKVRLMRLVIERMAAVAKENDAGLIAVVLPSKIDACDDLHRALVGERYPGHQRRALSSTLEEMLAELAIPCVGLYEPFRRHGAEACYWRGWDNHWNDVGQDLAARLTAELVTERGLLLH